VVAPARRARAKFLSYFPDGFRDETYVETERAFKWQAHREWEAQLGRNQLGGLLARKKYKEAATRVVRIEARTMLLFSFEKMALRDAALSSKGARPFVTGLFEWLYGPGSEPEKFARWCDVVAALPRRQTRVLTWPVVTVFGFIARPRPHLYLKPTVTKAAAAAYDYPFEYRSRPNWRTYANLLDFARTVRRDIADLRPRDMIDIQGFLWVLGSEEYPD
jgi:hypothetical protein